MNESTLNMTSLCYCIDTIDMLPWIVEYPQEVCHENSVSTILFFQIILITGISGTLKSASLDTKKLVRTLTVPFQGFLRMRNFSG